MISSFSLKECGPIENIHWKNLSNINVIIGRNGTGKTILLKMLYAIIKAVEGKRGDELHSVAELLLTKLYWTFQLKKIGDLVRKDAKTLPLECDVQMDEGFLRFSFGKDTEKKIVDIEGNAKRNTNSIFLPAKEVLSLFPIIIKSREEDKIFGFDDTYYDLVKALQISTRQGRNYEYFAKSREQLEKMFDGKVIYDEEKKEWYFRERNRKFSIHQTAEGIKKVAMLDRLLGNRYLKAGSIIFIDEPESALHPGAISKFMEIIKLLSNDMQFFIATHSFFVIKKLYLIAQKDEIDIPLLSLDGTNSLFSNLRDELPPNPIVQEAIDLYEEEIDIVWPK